ncbi:replication initiation protein [Hymenobacter sp. UV11]|uniref:replication initiation protein n=1 Tax=Hymenobacter sp. UV11 TaxID=1849735 RepID=UPI0010F1C93C|nr:replication initiation protein [Hymenobacter sp. UV11]TDN38591.1 hypothetical protein A8B98_22870 [Hymenobacter sp. UV11]
MPKQPYPGTSFDRARDQWKARVMRDGRRINLGYYPTQEAAYAAIEAAKNKPEERTEPELPPNHVELVAKAQRTKSVAQHNLLVEAPNTQTVLEARIFALMLRSIRRGDTVPTAVVIPLNELYPSGHIGGQQYQLLDEAMVRMMSSTIRIPQLKTGDVHLISLCESMRLDAENKLLVASFSHVVMPYLVDLMGHFTVADVDELLTIKSASTHRLYWLLRSWQYKSPHTVSVETLRELTAGDAYPRYVDYRNKVLKPSVSELNELSFDITYKEMRRRGRTVTSIEFTIGQKPAEVETSAVVVTEKPKAQPKPQLSDLQQKVTTRLTKLKLTEAQIKKVLEVIVGEELEKLMKLTYPVLRDLETKAKPNDNVAASTMTLLKSNFPAFYRLTN